MENSYEILGLDLFQWVNWAAALLYGLASIFIWRNARTAINKQPQKAHRRKLIIMMIVGAFLLHSIELYSRLFQNQGGKLVLDLSLGHSISLVAWMAILLYLAASLFRPILNLGIAVLPTAALATHIGGRVNPVARIVQDQTLSADLHLILAVTAFGVLSLAFAQATLVLLQEHQLRRHLHHSSTDRKGVFFPALPPLQTMETILFQLLIIGFMLLTANLVTGLVSSQQNTGLSSGLAIEFNHHTILTLAAWLGFGLLILGHFVRGWRGQQAARYTMIGFGVFILGYFGPRIVRELILVTPQ